MAVLWQPMAAHRMRDIRCNNKRSVPPSAWRHLQPKSWPPLRKEGKKRHSRTRKKVLSTLQSLVDKTQRIKSTAKAGVLPLIFELPLFIFFYFFSLFARQEEVYTLALIDCGFRLFLKPRALAQKTWDLRLSAAFEKLCAPVGKLSQWILPMAFQVEVLMWGINPLKLDLFHLDGG